MKRILGRITVLCAVMVVGAGIAQPAYAVPPEPLDLTFPAGVACAFKVHVVGEGGEVTTRTVRDASGRPVVTTQTGKGQDVTITNTATGATLSLPSARISNKTLHYSDGSSLNIFSGTNALILYPTDVPAGPSITLYKGTVTFTDDGQTNFVVKQVAASTRDICAELS